MPLAAFLRRLPGIRSRLEEMRTPLFRTAYAWSHDRALAEDLAQETLAKALTHVDQLRDPERLRSWLFGILANQWRDHLRALRPLLDIDTLDDEWPSPDPTPDEACGRAQVAAQVRCAVARLPMGQRQVLTLVDLEEFSYAEVALALGIPIGTVMSRLCRARTALRAYLAPQATAPVAHLRTVK